MSALEAAIASSAITQRSMLDISSNINSIFERASNERKFHADLVQGMVVNSQNYRKQVMDEQFRAEDLKIREKALQTDSIEKASTLGISRMNAEAHQLSAQADMMKVTALLEQDNTAKKNKPYLDSLYKQIGSITATSSRDSKSLDAEESSYQRILNGVEGSATNPAIKGMSDMQKHLDKKDPNGYHAKLNAVKQKRIDLQNNIERINLLNTEASHVARGGEPGTYLQLPTPNAQSLNEGEMPLNPMLLPNSDGSYKDSSKNVENFSDNPDLNKVQYGQIPKTTEQGLIPDLYNTNINPIFRSAENKPEVDPEVEENDMIGKSRIYDKSIPVEDAKEWYQSLSQSAKEELKDNANSYAIASLENYAIGKQYDFNKPYESGKDEKDASNHLSEMYERSGGNPDSLRYLKVMAEKQLMSLTSSVWKEKGEDGELLYPEESDKKFAIANKYSEWVQGVFAKKKEDEASNKESSLKSGIPIPNISEYLPKDITTKEDQDKILDDIEKNIEVSGDRKKKSEYNKKVFDAALEFDKEFGGVPEEVGFNKVKFFNTIINNPVLSEQLVRPDGMDKDGMDGFKINSYNKEILNKIRSMNKSEALDLYTQFKTK